MTSTQLTGLAVGDLVFLYLAQDGTFDTSNTAGFGAQTSSTVNAGKWQINRVLSRPSLTSVLFECDLDPAFNNVPANSNGYHTMVLTRFVVASTLVLNPNVVLSAPVFSSHATISNQGGGVLPILAQSITMMSGSSINADYAGFSGGSVKHCTTTCAYCSLGCNTIDWFVNSCDFGGQRGASIAPYSEGLKQLNPLYESLY